MSYTIHVNINQYCGDRFHVVEKTVWHYANGGSWSECNGQLTLTMGGSGTSGTLRFKNPCGDYFVVALGVHNYKRWCDIVTNLSACETGSQIQPTYYCNGGRGDMLWKQLERIEKCDCRGKRICVEYYRQECNTYWANITIS